MNLIDGKLVASEIRKEIAEKIADAKTRYGKSFRLTVIIAGNDPASEIYVRNKAKACEEVGIESETVRLPKDVAQTEISRIIKEKVSDPRVDGILIQLPLPEHLDADKLLALIPAEKDVDGFSDGNVAKLTRGDSDALLSCTPHGIIKLLDYYGIPLAGKRAVVIGRSNIVGKPMAFLLLGRDCTVTICHSKTKDLKEITKTADVIVCAVGKKHILTADMVKDGAVVVDAGINRVDGKIYGDADFENVSKVASYITPVPGGVGPMTITMLLYNTYTAGIRKLKYE